MPTIQFGNRTSYTDPLSRATTSVYDRQGNLTSQTDPRLNKTQYGYDTLNRKTLDRGFELTLLAAVLRILPVFSAIRRVRLLISLSR